ncbi:MAG: hypothetical protein E5Y89_12850 [Mesorhizobium sp.]|nr:MAG: hypothetical protein E5Y89_12850 [Mesorhizobium sp.]
MLEDGQFYPYQPVQFMDGLVAPIIGTQPRSLAHFAEQAGLLVNLAVCLDPASIDSYPGSGQTWSDISGNARHFVLGATGSSSTDDPTFNGTAGALDNTAYFSSDGGDGFLKASANDTFFNGLHNVGSAWTMIVLEYYVSAYGPGGCSQSGSFTGTNTANGITTFITSAKPRIGMGNGSVALAADGITTGSPMVTSAMLMTGLGARLNSTTSRDWTGYVNGTYETNNYTSPTWASSSAASATFALGIAGSTFIGSSRRIYGFMMFDKLLVQSEFDALRTLIQTRHPTI